MNTEDNMANEISGDFTQAIEAVKESTEALRQYNEGARIADDYFCVDCGERGYIRRCPWCERN